MELRTALRAYTKKDNRLAYLSLLSNLVIYALSAFTAILAVGQGDWLVAVPAVVVLAFAGVRLYVLQHDLGHLSLFETRAQNRFWGYVVSPFTFAAYPQMTHNHNLHHAYVGDLNERHTTEIYTMTVAEWERAGVWQRLYYRLYRHPAVLIPVGSFWTYFFVYRWPKNAASVGIKAILAHNLAILALFAALHLWQGWSGVFTFAFAIWLGGCIGVALVYLQHNFEGTWWDRRPDLDFERAAIQGGSCLDFGWVFDEMVANITKHDIHHLVAAIPSYRLRAAHREMEKTHALRRISFREALHAFSLRLWDEETENLVPFPKERRMRVREAGAE
ncbi:fatty acid desaturase [Aliiroseovarius sp.]|uniref:fatty acid desaturase n=1 Tax=Aliiroseovarius sp. TaxID=1872442 RepID=UPI00260D1EF2|nr:fatty acid desaturase [Aliiroseovarius sp.]